MACLDSWMKMDRKYLNIDEVSKYLGLKKSLLYSYVEAGEIPYYRVGKLLRFKVEGVDQWMEDRRRAKTAITKARRSWLI